MNQSSPFGFPPFDPSKMDPKLLMELSQLVQQLPPDQLGRMQTLMHNMMAGFDVRKEMEDFEKNLPPAFRMRMSTLFAGQLGTMTPESSSPTQSAQIFEMPQDSHRQVNREAQESVKDSLNEAADKEMNLKEARLTILRAVAGGQMTVEEAEKLLFIAVS